MKRPLIIVIAFVISLVISFGAVTWYFNRGGVPSVASSAIGGPFVLTRQDGAEVTEAMLKGKPSLLFFGFTHCPDICPTTLFEVSQVMRALGADADKVQGVFVTIDPARDTPEQMKLYLSSFDPHIVGLSGSEEEVGVIAKAYRVYARKVELGGGDYTMDHTAIVYLINKDGRFVAPFNMKRKPIEAAAELRRYF